MGEPEYPVRLGCWRVDQVVAEGQTQLEGILLACQEHKGEVVVAEECESGVTAADGIMVQSQGQKVAVVTADCMPLVVTTDKEAAVLHVSRKSLIYGLLDKIEDMVEPEEVQGVYVGPHICPRHFDFEWLGEELQQFKMLFPRAMSWDKPWQLSLRSAVQSYFDQWEVAIGRTIVDDRCTYDEEGLPSYRRYLEREMDPTSGRLVTVVWKE